MHLGPVCQGSTSTSLWRKAWKIDVNRKASGRSREFRIAGPGVTAHVPGSDRGTLLLSSRFLKSLLILSAQCLLNRDADSGDLTPRGNMGAPRFLKSVCLWPRRAAGLLFFCGVSHTTKEVSDWRCHRRETDPNL